MQISNTVLVIISFALIGYLFGNILSGIIISKIKKKNIRVVGSQNIGATNISRELGVMLGVVVLLLDTLKSYIAIILCWIIYWHSLYLWWSDKNVVSFFSLTIYIAGLFAIIGHCFPIIYLIALIKTKSFVKAKAKAGGKGASTMFGLALAISPWLALISIGIFMIIILISHYVSLSSMCTSLIIGFFVLIPRIAFLYFFKNDLFVMSENYPIFLHKVLLMSLLIFCSIIVICRHHANIARLINRQEKRYF